jgi:hypothetical protein
MPIDVDPDRPDTEPEITDAIALRRPEIPTTLSELAALKGEALEVIEARVQVIATLRLASIRATHPEDWVLFRAKEEHGGQVVGYLQDAGCDRVRDLWGIEIFDVGKPEKVTGAEPGVFHYLIEGSGRCKLTRQVLEAIEGGRSSTDDFVKGKTGVELDLLIRKAARANLDGNITRELAGMKTVPVDELAAAWKGTSKRVEQCRKGRGFGSADERVGGRSERAPDVDPPVCPHCNSKGSYRPAKGDRRAFYGCPNWEKHKDKKFIVDAEQWVADQTKKAAAPTPAANGAPLKADDIHFGSGGSREPGQEG